MHNQCQPCLVVTPPSHLHSFTKMHTVQGDYKNSKSKTQKMHTATRGYENSEIKVSGKNSYNQCQPSLIVMPASHLIFFSLEHTVDCGVETVFGIHLF